MKNVTAPTAQLEQNDAQDIDAPQPANSRTLDDAPLCKKVIWLVAATSIWSGLVGIGTTQWGLEPWMAILYVLSLALFFVIIGHFWVTSPIERLVHRLEKIADSDRPGSTRQLPQDRSDEIGRLSRAVHQMATNAIRHQNEATQLRRTLDDRVEKATHQATVQLTQMAMRDPLTGLGNRRFLENTLEDLVNTCFKSRTDLICVAIDMDNFKQVNDKLGHASGDELLVFAGNLIRGSIRENDAAIRLGGDEFLVLMPGCDLERAKAFTERMTKLFNEYAKTALTDDIPAGMSAGIASLLFDRARDGQHLMELADKDLYKNKQTGKQPTRN